ncbi:hypothetical protein MMC10_008126 [Thelotrema lepadinum]|nr:hypothetical protein [Thelotrema lepadinum]
MRSSLFSLVCFLLASALSQSSTPASVTPVPAGTSATTPASQPSTPFPTGTPPTNGTGSSGSGSRSSAADNSTAPDVHLNVPQLSVGRIELDVDDLSADINLNAQVAGLVTINAGVQVSIQKVNITIADVEASLELTVRLGHLVDIVNRVFSSLDLNPLLITALNDITSVVDQVVGAVDGLLGSITQGGSTLSFLVDNLGNIVQQVAGADGGLVSSIVGNYLSNMTFTGVEKTLSGGDIQKTFEYSPLNALVDIVFNAAGQVVQATVQKGGNNGTTTATATSAASSATGVARRWK